MQASAKVTWSQVLTVCGTIVVAVWTASVFLNEITGQRLDRSDERQIFTREVALENHRAIGELRAEIVAVKCRMSVDLCGPGN